MATRVLSYDFYRLSHTNSLKIHIDEYPFCLADQGAKMHLVTRYPQDNFSIVEYPMYSCG